MRRLRDRLRDFKVGRTVTDGMPQNDVFGPEIVIHTPSDLLNLR